MSETTALGFSITANIDGNRQIVFQSFIALDAPDSEANANLDRINGLIDRMRAKYELPALKEERAKYAAEIAQAKQDIAEAELNHGKAQASLDVQIETLLADRKMEFEAGYERFRHDGRQGTYAPKGAAKVNLDRMDSAVEQAKAAKHKNDQERDQAMAGFSIALARRSDAVDELDKKIADLEAQFG